MQRVAAARRSRNTRFTSISLQNFTHLSTNIFRKIIIGSMEFWHCWRRSDRAERSNSYNSPTEELDETDTGQHCSRSSCLWQGGDGQVTYNIETHSIS